MEIVDADQVLETRSAPTRKPGAPVRFGRGEYYVSILGKPSAAEPWMMQFGGHHLAINVTMAGPASVLAPTHTGAQPASYSVDGKLVRPLGDENDRAFELINALNAEQQKQAILGYEVRNLVLGPGTDGKTIAPEGVRASTFNPAQRTVAACARPRVGRHSRGSGGERQDEGNRVESERNLFRMGRPHDERQGRLFPGARAGRFPRVRPARRGGEQRRSHSHHLSRACKRLRREGGAAVKALGAAVLVLLATCGEVSGHQLDEYLQATRVSIARDRVTLDVDLTPGVTIAPAIVETLDANADNIIVPSEAGAYGRAMLSDVVVTFDGRSRRHGADADRGPHHR